MSVRSPQSRAVLERVRRRPQPAPPLPKSVELGLAYQLSLRPDAAQEHALAALLSDVPILDARHSGETSLAVFHWEGFTRIETLTPGVYGREFVLLLQPGGGMAYLDPADRLVFQADREQVLPVRHPRVTGARLRVEPGGEVDGRPTRMAVLDIPGPPALRYRLWCVADERLSPHARSVLCTLLGCADILSECGLPMDALLALGLPVRSEVVLLDRGGDDAPLMVGEVSHLELRRPADGELEIPAGYDDLRDSERLAGRLGPEGYATPPVRLSSLRPGRSDAERRSGQLRTRGGRLPLGWAVPPTGLGPAWIPGPGPGAGPTPGGPGGPGEPGVPAPGHETDRFRIPQCLPATFASLVSLVTEQQLLDDLRFLVNRVARRLDTFKGSGGTFLIDWLDQWAATSEVANGKDGLFCILRKAPGSAFSLGVLDRLARRQVRAALADGTIGSQVPMPPGLLLEVVDVIGSKPPAERWDALNPASRDQLRELYLQERLGKIRLKYKSSTSPSKTFFDLMNIQLSDLEFQLEIRRTDPLRHLDADKGVLKLRIELPYLRANAEIGRWPTGEYFALLGVSAVGCFLMPLLCLISGPLATVGMFLLSDYAYARVKLDKAALDATIKFVPDTAGVLRPFADPVAFDADVAVHYMSYVPTGLHQLASFVYMLVGNHTDLVIDEIESQLKDKLEELFEDTLALRFPPSFGPVPLSGISSKTDGALRDFLYLEAGLNAGAGSGSPPYITQVDPGAQQRLLDLRGRFSFDRRYAGFVISQNFLNHFVNVRWKEGAFNHHLGGPERKKIAELLAAVLGQPLDVPLDVHLWPAVSPRTVLTPRLHAATLVPLVSPAGTSVPGPYATTFFDDLRLCVGAAGQDGGSQLEIQFAGQAFTQVGFGGLDPETRELDLGRFMDGFMDLFFDLARLGVRLIHPEVQGIASRGPVFAALKPSHLAALAPALTSALASALWSRRDTVIPTAPGNPFFHRYDLPGATLDVHLEPFRGNLYGWLGLSGISVLPPAEGQPPDKGLIEIFPGGRRDLDTLDCYNGKLLLPND